MSQNRDILGIGTDIIEIDRIAKAIERHKEKFIETIFTKKEKEYCLLFKDPSPRFAARFAAKEAVRKAFGSYVTSLSWHDVEIVNDTSGKPEVRLSLRLQKMFPSCTFLLSISHSRNFATATALLQGSM